MAQALIYLNGAWVDICSIKYYIYTNGVFENLHSRPFTFYDEQGNPYQFQCIIPPQSPNVVVTSFDNDSISYSIDLVDPANVDLVEYYLNGTKTGEVANPTGDLTHTESGLTESTQYEFYAVATNAAGSVQSNTTSTTTDIDAPPQPVITEGLVTYDIVRINVDIIDLALVEHVDVYDNGVFVEEVFPNSSTFVYEFNILPETTYDFYVESVNGTGRTRSNTLTITTPPAPPDAPTLSVDSRGTDSVTLSWTEPENAETYAIYRRRSDGNSVILAGGLTSADIPYTDDTTSNNFTYYYEVTASNESGESPHSNEVSYTDYSPPSAPSNLITDFVQSSPRNEVSIAWDASNGEVDQYVVERRLSNTTDDWGVVAVTSEGDTNAIDVPPGEDVQYDYRAKAEGPGGDSGYSNISTIFYSSDSQL